MKPTATEVALIAATLSGGKNPERLIPDAIRLHSACVAALQSEPAQTPAKIVTLDDLLAVLAKDQNIDRRRRLFHDYLTEKIEETLRATPGGVPRNLAEIVRNYYRQLREDGVAVDRYADFPEWLKRRLSTAKARGGKAAAKSKRESKHRAEEAKRYRKAPHPDALTGHFAFAPGGEVVPVDDFKFPR